MVTSLKESSASARCGEQPAKRVQKIRLAHWRQNLVYYRESINPGAFRRKEPILMNITKRDVQELRKRLTKKACTFDRVTGCYINSGKEVILK